MDSSVESGSPGIDPWSDRMPCRFSQVLGRFSQAKKKSALIATLFVTTFLIVVSGASSQSSFVPFEVSLVKPLGVWGRHLLALHPATQCLVVYDTQRQGEPVIVSEIPVGLGPVSVRVRPHTDEAWVVNAVSDDVTVIDLKSRNVVARIAAGDEPADVAFTHDGLTAVITLGGRDKIVVVDADSRKVLRRIDVPGVSPRTIETSTSGRHFIVSFFKSGNETTILPESHPETPVTDPQVGHIISSSDPRSSPGLSHVDIVAIRTSDYRIDFKVSRVGTILFSHGIHPTNGNLYVTNTDARNLIQYVTNLRGHWVDNRVSIIQKSKGVPEVAPVDLNPNLDYSILPNPQARESALAQPTDLTFDPQTGTIYVAAFGSQFVAVLTEEGEVVQRIPVGRGPRGLAFLSKSKRLFCLNSIDETISEIDTKSARAIATFPLGTFSPTPAEVREGRSFLYDARLSGNGTGSCASCHVDGDRDNLAWDLGDPSGPVLPGAPPGTEFSPLKGPMITQTLRGLRNTGALHWRGDRETFLDFGSAFITLLGSDRELPPSKMSVFEDFVHRIEPMPNPNMNRDRTWNRAASRGFRHFTEGDDYNACIHCHKVPLGTSIDFIPSPDIINLSQPFKPAKLTTSYTKNRRFNRSGFGFGQDGSSPSLVDFLTRLRNDTAPALPLAWRHDLSELVLQWDSGIAPAVGREFLIDDKSSLDPNVREKVAELISEVHLLHCDVIARGWFYGEVDCFVYRPSTGGFVRDSSVPEGYSLNDLLLIATKGHASFMVQGVPVGSGARLSIDQDNDLLPDRDEARWGTSPRSPDTDQDGIPDGWEVLEGSDPRRRTSTPHSMTRPVIHALIDLPPMRPFGAGLRRITLNATRVYPGATLIATRVGGDAATTRHPIFQTGKDQWTTFDVFPQIEVFPRPEGWIFQIKNPTGASSPSFRIE